MNNAAHLHPVLSVHLQSDLVFVYVHCLIHVMFACMPHRSSSVISPIVLVHSLLLTAFSFWIVFYFPVFHFSCHQINTFPLIVKTHLLLPSQDHPRPMAKSRPTHHLSLIRLMPLTAPAS